jgi:hypothetical protein
MKKMQQKNKRIQIYKIQHKLPLKPSINGFGENINQLSLYVIVSLLDISLLNMVT